MVPLRMMILWFTNRMRSCPCQERSEQQSQSSCRVQSVSGAEVSPHALLESENVTERLSNSFNADDLVRSHGTAGKAMDVSDATCSSHLITGEINSQIRSGDLLDRNTSIKPEDQALGSENEGLVEVRVDAARTCPTEDEFEYLVKWVGKSHIHNEWIKETELKFLAKRKLDNYKFKHKSACINLVDEKWCKPQRIIAKRQDGTGCFEVLVKWCGLSYDECTWESIDEPVIQKHLELLQIYEYFEKAAVAVEEQDNSLPDKRPGEISTLTEQPVYIKGGTLFPHQMEALNWLRKCWWRKKNVILADEMGLGKTISASAFLCSLYREFNVNAPCLVLVPLSTMPNWMAEFSVWTPQLNVVEYHGGAKARSTIRQFEWHALSGHNVKKNQRSYKFNVLLTTYEMIIADASQLRSVPWEVLIVDEGHRLKNTGSKLVQLLNTFSFSQRVLLTGTPLQNNIGEMHNLLKFLQLDAFLSLADFEEKFNNLSTAEQVEELKKLVAPHMLRRLKKDAMQNIPPKMERVVPVELSSLQAEYYRALLTKNYQVLRQAGRANQHQSLVNIVVQLRKVCNHPYLIPGTEPETGSIEFLQEMRIKASAKLTLLHAMLRVLKEQGHRVLIFSQMTRLLDILEDYLSVEFGSHAYERVDGSISVADRQMAIARFNQDSSRFVFLLSTRACGLGINLATADTVIIYDSDFNPHADIQAMNRAHRIGQSKRLLVYRLVVRASVEERILQLAKRKLMLDHLFANKSGSQKEVEDILKWGTEELFQDCSAGEGALAASCAEDVEGMVEADGKLRKRSGGLGDVYEDTCHKVGRPKLLWDDAAIARLLDRSEIGTETVETEGESDMLGSFKAWDWNEQEAADDQEGNNNPVKDKDTDSNVEANNIISVQVTEEESDWDKILRTRWEKLQTEEEGALGRGKRTRKTVSYKEDFSMAAAEVSTESGDEDEDPEPEYTPAGRALKSKLAKLRARQKERIASRGCKDSLGNFGHFYTSSTGLSACNGSQLELPTITTSMFLPVRLSEQDLRTLISDTGLTPNIFSMQNNDPATRMDAAVLDIQPSSAMKQSGLSNEVVRDLCERVDFTFNHMMKADLVNNSRDPSGLSSIEERCMKRDSYQDPEGEAHTDSRHSAERESPENPTTALDIRVEAFDFQRRHSKDIGAACNLLEQSKPPFELTEKHTPLKVTSEVFSLRSGLGFGHWEVHGPSQSMDCQEKSRESLGLDIANSLQGVKDIATSSQLTAPKSETEVGSGSTIIASYPQQIDAVKGRNFPFRSSSGDERATPCMPEATIWTEEELDALWSGVRRYGRGNWGVMLQDSKLCFSKLKTAKDLELRWSQEQIKFLGGSFDFRDLLPGREGSKPLFTPFCAGFPIPSFQRDVLGFGGPIDLSNPASLSQTKGLAFSDFDIERTGWRGSRTETVKLPTLPHFGVEVNNRLTHISSTSESTAFLRDPVPWIDVGQKLDLLTAGIPKVNFPSDNQVARSGRDLVFGSAKGTLQSNISNAAFQTNQSSVDLQSGGLLPRVSGSENEWRFSNLQLRFEKGLKHEVTDFSKSPVFSDKLAQSLHELPVVKPNLNLLSQHSLPENRSSGVQQNVSQFNVNVDKEQSKVKQVTQLPSVSVDEVMEKPVSSSLPHWLREAFKPPAVDMPTMPSTVGAVSHAISLIYRDCSPTLPAWVPPAPLPIAPHRKTKKRRKRKKGVGLGCRMMGDAHAGTREQLGNVLLPPLLTSGKKSQFPLLGMGNPGIFDNRLHDSQHSLQLLNGSLLPAFSHSLGPKYDWHGGESPFPKLDLQGQFPGIGNLPLTTCTISESMPVSSLTSSIMSYGKLVTPDLSLSSLLPRGKSRLNAQEQVSVQQLWPSHGSGNNQSLHIVSQAHATDLKPLEMDPDVQGKQKSICLSADTDDSSSKTQSDTNVKHGGAVGGKKLDDEASSEETVSDSKSIAD
ncbi:hypothetical protein KP509_1Z205000 [Ceratopteris richardii]|nr:hypothetical protein KP509_1Z205000 [Ceratopteris richardii]